MIDGVEDALRALLHDNPAGLAAAVALIAALIMLVLRAAAPSKPKTFLDPQQVRPSGRGASRLRVQTGGQGGKQVSPPWGCGWPKRNDLCFSLSSPRFVPLLMWIRVSDLAVQIHITTRGSSG